ncbi:DUF1769-domain-containing protein [Wallemia mellicola]|nr:hypothetical protein E3Q24_02332 [Wallemia mellicola]TIB83801.1 DUF1769-domain-containing protein [Wallemia mellicola]TIB86826.1 DUF1769-domain-containing protein [Wallemia mellicola]TIC22524.1 DUF1769-domain-containing protein [Wallemia mellicola]TIC39749.1 DUF1769-domain-containing protein [Wallemia mellicola]
MTIKLIILAGNSEDDYRVVDYDKGVPVDIDNAHFTGNAVVLLKDNSNPHGYFTHESNSSVTWSIQLRGLIKEDDVDCDDLIFGNQFERPIRDRLPWGTSIAVKFIKYLDPTLSEDLYSDKPWAFSPVCSTVERLNVSDNTSTNELFKEDNMILEDDVKCLTSDDDKLEHGNPTSRRRHFHNESNRKGVMLSNKIVALDFAKGFIDFSTLSLSFPEINLNIGLLKHWDGQPVRFYLRNRKTGHNLVVIQFIIEDVGQDAPEEAKEMAAHNDIGTNH